MLRGLIGEGFERSEMGISQVARHISRSIVQRGWCGRYWFPLLAVACRQQLLAENGQNRRKMPFTVHLVDAF